MSNFKKIAGLEDRPPKSRIGKVSPSAPSKSDSATPERKSRELPSTDKPAFNPQAPSFGGASLSLKAVKQMQLAILNFANVAGSTDVTAMKDNTGLQEGNQSRSYQTPEQSKKDIDDAVLTTNQEKFDRTMDAQKSKEQLLGSDPFGSFLVQQYAVNDPHGKQYLNVDVSGQDARKQNSMDNASLRGIIDSIKRLGSPGTSGGEKAADGIWMERTDNAIKNVYALTNAIFNFAKDLNVASKYTEADLNAFRSNIPRKYTDLKSAEDKANAANVLTPQINKATEFFSSIKVSILNNANYRPFIDQKKPFVQYKKEVTPKPLDEKQEQVLKHYTSSGNLVVPNVKLPFIQNSASNYIWFKELESLDNFKAFIKRTNPGQEPTQADLKKYLEQVNAALLPQDRLL
jgi:hypothetical protein